MREVSAMCGQIASAVHGRSNVHNRWIRFSFAYCVGYG